MLENGEDREYTRRVKDNSKILEETYDLKIKTSEHKVAADEKQEGTDVWDLNMQNKTNLYKTTMETLE